VTAAARQPAGRGTAQIPRIIDPNSRLRVEPEKSLPPAARMALLQNQSSPLLEVGPGFVIEDSKLPLESRREFPLRESR
jgi:hypothetical protein